MIGHVGRAVIESATVMHGRGGVPENGIVAARLDDGSRVWGIVRDPSEVTAMTTEDVIGRPVDLREDGTATLG